MNVHRFDLSFYTGCQGDNFDEYFAAIQQLGISNIGGGLSMEHLRDQDRLGKMREAAENRGLTFTALHSPCGLIWEDSVEQSIATSQIVIDGAAALNARSTVWHFRYIHATGPSEMSGGNRVNQFLLEDLDRRMAEVLPEVCSYAVEKGIEINLENLPCYRWSRVSQEILDFISTMNLPNLGFIIDTGHAHCNDESPAEIIRQAGPLLRDTHFHDNLGSRGFDFNSLGTQADISTRDLHLIPGLGTINWVGVIRALREIEYPFPITFEEPQIKGHPDPSIVQWSRCMDLTLKMWRVLEEAATFIPNPEE